MDSMYSTSPGQLDQTLYNQVSTGTLTAVLKALGAINAVNVDAATNPSYVAVAAGTNLVVVDSSAHAPALDALKTDAGGALYPSGNDAVTISNSDPTPVTVLAKSSAFFEVSSGNTTVVGGDAPTLVVDASHDGSVLNLQAGSGQSYLIGGTGFDTLSGSTSTTGHAVLVAKDGQTLLQGGLGADSLYAGGHTNAMAGAGANQRLYGGFSPDANDTLQAGAGGYQQLGVAGGSNLLSDVMGNGTDTLFSGVGSDTLVGGAAGTVFALGLGHTTVFGGTGNDNVFVSKGAQSSVILGGGGTDFVTFNGYAHSDATVTTDTNGVTTVKFASTGQTATLSGVAAVFYGNDTPAHS